MTTDQITIQSPRHINIQPHRLGMGWHYIWEYDPPIAHHIHRADGTPCSWREGGESSEGCIMWLSDCFAREHLNTNAQQIYREAYKAEDDEEFEDDWLDRDVLRGMWATHTVLPSQWTPFSIRKLLHDLEDVNYQSFLLRLSDLIEARLPDLAASLPDWCKPATTPRPTHTSAR